jgi:hypothetical protein
MTPTPFTLTLRSVPRFVAGPSTALAVLRNTGGAPARVVTEPGDADHGRTIAPAATIELEPTGRFIWLACDTTTAAEVTCYTVDDLRENASAEFRVPVEFIRGRTKAEITDSVVAFYSHEVAE